MQSARILTDHIYYNYKAILNSMISAVLLRVEANISAVTLMSEYLNVLIQPLYLHLLSNMCRIIELITAYRRDAEKTEKHK